MDALGLAESKEILRESHLGVLALAHDDSGYAIPLFFGYDEEAIYFHCHPGVKDEWIDSTKEACLVVTHIESPDIWESVQVFGPVEKVSLSNDLEAAKSALFQLPFPPAEGHRPSGAPVRSDQAVYYLKLAPSRIEGKSSAHQN